MTESMRAFGRAPIRWCAVLGQTGGVLHTFIDESYGENDYYVGGIVVTDAQLDVLESRLVKVRAAAVSTFGLTDDVELHAHEIMHGQGEWACMLGQVHESVYLCRQVVRAVVDSGADIHLQGVDVARLKGRYRYPGTPYAVCLRHLLERVQDRCDKSGELSTVTADILDESDTAVRVIAGYETRSTPGYRPTKLSSIVHPINYVDSRTSLGVQAADVVTYMLRRHLEVTDAHPRALKAARSIYNTMRPSLRTCRKWEP